jgi:hypothetical protein
MLTVRRLYILAAAFIGLLIFMHGSSELLRLVFLIFPQDAEFGLGSDWWRDQLSLNLALIAVGTPLWLGHWLWAQRLNRDGTEERSALRSLFFLGVLGVTLIASASAAGEILFIPFARLAGGILSWPDLLDSLAGLIVYGLFWTYHVRQRPPAQSQTGAAATITRWYWYAASFGSLGIVVTSLIPLLSTILQQLLDVRSVDATWWELPVASDISWVIAGSVGWAYHWATIQRQIGDAESPELRSALRKVYLYLMVGSAAAGALLAVGRILYLALLSVLGVVEDRLDFIDDLVWVVPIALVAATGWYYHRNHLRQDAALVTELPRQAAIRRIYSYLLSAIGISLLSVGVFGILRLVIGILTGQADTLDLPENFLERQLSLYVTLLLVGVIAWVWYWRQIQQQLNADGSGEERASLVRRIYLYLVSSATVIAVVVAIGTLLYEALRAVLGTSSGNDLIDALNIHVSVALIAVVVLLYHVRFLRQEHGIAPKRRIADVSEDQAPPTGKAAAPETGPHSLVVTLTGGNLSSARALLEQSALPEGTDMTILESTLSTDEVRQRLRAEPDAEA